MSSSSFVRPGAPVAPVVHRRDLSPLSLPLSLLMLFLLSTAAAAQRPAPPSESVRPAPQCREVVAPAAPSCEAVDRLDESSGLPDVLRPDTVRIAVGAQRAVLDPITGELRAPDGPVLSVPRRTLESFRVPSHSLQPRPRPGGGWVLGLRGRMLQPLFGTVSPDGRPTVSHAWKPADGPADPPPGPPEEPPANTPDTSSRKDESDGSR